MTHKNGGSGVEIHGASIRITFWYEGKRRRETLGLKPTTANLKHSRRQRHEIIEKIKYGIFVYAEYFPESRYVKSKEQAPVVSTFSQACTSYMKTKGRLSPATLSQYRDALNLWEGELGKDTLVRKITHREIAEVVGSYEWSSAKRCNNALIPLRGVFNLVYPANQSKNNPMQGIENSKWQQPPPDPLSVEEMKNSGAHVLAVRCAGAAVF